MSSIILLSGGLDSAVLLARVIQLHRDSLPSHNIECLTFDYGQMHSREISAAEKIAKHYKVSTKIVDLPKFVFHGSALTGGKDLPKGLHYADPKQADTVVPNRNMVMLSIAASYAVQKGYDTVQFAAHAGDATIYPDCRKEFVELLSNAMQLACGVHVLAPFLDMSKKEIVALGRRLGVPFEMTWSCYACGKKPCGRCGACIEREEALNVDDKQNVCV